MKKLLFVGDLDEDSYFSVLISNLRGREAEFQYTRATNYNDAGSKLNNSNNYEGVVIPTLGVDGRGLARDFLQKAKQREVRVFIGTGPKKLTKQAKDLGFRCLEDKIFDELVSFLSD